MIGMKATTVDETAKVVQAVDKASYRNLGHAAASIRKDAVESIKRGPGPSAEGSPPHTRRGQIRRAIRFAVEDKYTAVVGPRQSVVGQSAEPHEHGGPYKGQIYPARPTMGPAMERNLDRFANSWTGSVRQ